MNKTSQKRINLWLTWNFEREQQRLDRLSEEGLHLTKPGIIRSTYQRNSAVRYVYRLDYQPKFRIDNPMQDYLDLYEDAGWEFMGQCTGWHYFRQPWVQSNVQELYTDRDSLKQHYQRVRRLLGLTFLADAIICAVNVNNILMFSHSQNEWPVMTVIPGLLLAVTAVLGYGYIAIGRKLREIGIR